MISVIICSVDQQARAVISENIRQTIGVPYELLVIENDIERLSICAAYNKGGAASKFPYLCFVHEDVQFHTPGWGNVLIPHLQQQGTGMLGVAGATVKTKNPSPWWISHENELARKFYREYYIQSGRQVVSAGVKKTPGSQSALYPVASLDGFFLMCRKDLWQQVKFDERLLKGFHFYDLDICMSAFAIGFANYVCTGFGIEHRSSGSFANWIENAEIFHDKWRSSLPVCIGACTAADLQTLEYFALVDYIHELIRNKKKRLSLKYTTALLLHYRFMPSSAKVLKALIRSWLK